MFRLFLTKNSLILILTLYLWLHDLSISCIILPLFVELISLEITDDPLFSMSAMDCKMSAEEVQASFIFFTSSFATEKFT